MPISFCGCGFLPVRYRRVFYTATCPLGPRFLSVVRRSEVVRISEVENVLFLWQSQSGARCLSVVWRLSVSRSVRYGRFHCIYQILSVFTSTLSAIVCEGHSPHLLIWAIQLLTHLLYLSNDLLVYAE